MFLNMIYIQCICQESKSSLQNDEHLEEEDGSLLPPNKDGVDLDVTVGTFVEMQLRARLMCGNKDFKSDICSWSQVLGGQDKRRQSEDPFSSYY